MNMPLSTSFSRRQFILGAAAGGLSAQGLLAESKAATGETLVQQLYSSLSEPQRKELCFEFDHPLRSKVDNNWHITKARVGALHADQHDLVKQIFNSLHSEEYRSEVLRQFTEDSGKEGFDGASIAIFGQPGTGKFEFVFTGRHCTRRCDGDSVEGAAFGGPIFYGHASKSFNESPKHEGNAYWFQAQRANEVFQALDGKQREAALLGTSRDEDGTDTVKLSGKARGLPGIAVSQLAADQKGLVRAVVSDLLKPFRKTDADEAMKYIDAGGFDNLHMAFYKNQDVGNDGVWDVWQLEGPNMVWYFRGDPHVHCWAHIRAPKVAV
jgi:hypothetical protein